jgi:phosphate/sulfate permease
MNNYIPEQTFVFSIIGLSLGLQNTRLPFVLLPSIFLTVIFLYYQLEVPITSILFGYLFGLLIYFYIKREDAANLVRDEYKKSEMR